MKVVRAVLLALIAAAGPAAPPVRADEPPRRIVTANLCADRLVLGLADRDRVVSVSPFAADRDSSTVADRAAGLPVNRGGIEEIIAFHPDLVVLGAFNAAGTAPMLRALGYKVHILPAADDLASVLAAIRSLAAALGVPERGEAMAAAFEARLAALPRPARPVRAAIYQAGGWSAGRGTLTDSLFRSIGIVNLAAEAGITGFGAFRLESLVAAAPDLIVFEHMGDEAPSIASELLRHPVLTRGHPPLIGVPMRLWACPDPALADAAALIAGAVR